MHDIIDLRSDTVTRPSLAMRKAIAEAEVGDAVYNEDPTVRKLEETAARILGKDAAIYVATGTMANALAIRLCAEPGDEVILEASAHPLLYEAGGSAAFSGSVFKTVPGENGIMSAEAVEEAIYEPRYYRPRQTAVLVENTSNRGGGTIYPLDTIEAISNVARKHSLRLHMDGARLWNASVATGISPARYASFFDTVSTCFSKGLGAPVGSCLAGSGGDIERAWHYRHMMGGSWRQAGILAAAALYAVEHNVERLAEDHRNARTLADGLGRIGFPVLNPVQTNMVYFGSPDAPDLLEHMKRAGILASQTKPGVIRCVTHLDIDAEDLERTLEVLRGLA